MGRRVDVHPDERRDGGCEQDGRPAGLRAEELAERCLHAPRQAVRAENAERRVFESALLLVALDHLGPPQLGVVRVAAGFAQRAGVGAASPRACRARPSAARGGAGLAGVPGRLALPELVLLGDEVFDRPVDLSVVHPILLSVALTLAEA